MHFTTVFGKYPVASLNGGDKFIEERSLDNFSKGAEVEVFVRLAEPAYGWRAVSLKTGNFRFGHDKEVVKIG